MTIIKMLFVVLAIIPSMLFAATGEADSSQFNQLFQQMLKNPTDASLAKKYSDMAAQMGDYEAAIPPLERMLLIDPDQPDIKLAIGRYYMKLGSNDMARVYLSDASKSAGNSKEVASEADSLLKQIK